MLNTKSSDGVVTVLDGDVVLLHVNKDTRDYLMRAYTLLHVMVNRDDPNNMNLHGCLSYLRQVLDGFDEERNLR